MHRRGCSIEIGGTKMQGGMKRRASLSPKLKPLMAHRPPDASEVLIDMIQEGADD